MHLLDFICRMLSMRHGDAENHVGGIGSKEGEISDGAKCWCNIC